MLDSRFKYPLLAGGSGYELNFNAKLGCNAVRSYGRVSGEALFKFKQRISHWLPILVVQIVCIVDLRQLAFVAQEPEG